MRQARCAIFALLAVMQVHPAQAHSPYYSDADVLSVDGRGEVSIKLLNGDGIFFADPMRAVVIDRSGTLLAASPMSGALTLMCTNHDPQRICVAYDELSRMIYEPKPDLWRGAGVIEQNGRPIEYPEYGMEEFGFVQREAKAAEIARAEFLGAIKHWPATAIAVVWWTLFGLLLLPVGRRLLGRERPGWISIGLRLITAALMLPITAYLWMLGPYSQFYLAFVSIAGMLVAGFITIRGKHPRRQIVLDR